MSRCVKLIDSGGAGFAAYWGGDSVSLVSGVYIATHAIKWIKLSPRAFPSILWPPAMVGNGCGIAFIHFIACVT